MLLNGHKGPLVKEGMPSTAIDSVSGLCHLPVAICPHTALFEN